MLYVRIDFELMWPLPGAVDKYVTLDWDARKVPGTSIPVLVGSANYKIYLVLSTPTALGGGDALACRARDCLRVGCRLRYNGRGATLIAEHYNGSGVVSYDIVNGATFCGLMDYKLSGESESLSGFRPEPNTRHRGPTSESEADMAKLLLGEPPIVTLGDADPDRRGRGGRWPEVLHIF